MRKLRKRIILGRVWNYQYVSILSILLILLTGVAPARAASSPHPVTEVHVVAKSSSSVTLAWSIDTNSVGSTSPGDYLIEYKTVGNTWVTFLHSPSVTKQIEVTKLAPNTSYLFRVSSVSSEDPSVTSAPVIADYWADGAVVGRSHACALMFDGAVQCWGAVGMLGNGTFINQRFPQNVLLPERASKISAEGAMTCAITESGDVYCWGYGIDGNGNVATNILTPVKVQSLSNIRDIAVGTDSEGLDNSICAVTQAFSVFCWGANSYGQLGNGSTDYALVPKQVISSVGFRKVAMGYGYMCLIGTDTNLYCTGENKYGQLGLGNITYAVTVPTQVTSYLSGFDNFADVATAFSTCVTNTSGKLFCWGRGLTNGQADGQDRLLPALIDYGHPSNGLLKSVSAFCSPDSGSQTTYCWGSEGFHFTNNSANLYSPVLTPSEIAPKRLMTRGGLAIEGMSGGGNGGLCLVESISKGGKVYCWGINLDPTIQDACDCARTQFGAMYPILPYVGTLNDPSPVIESVSPSSAAVGNTVSLSGVALSPVTILRLGGTAIPFYNSNGILSFNVPTWAVVGNTYDLTVTSIGGTYTNSNALKILTSPIVSINLTMTTGGQPLTGGSYTWQSQGRFAPSAPTPGNDLGTVTLTNVVSGPGTISVTGGQLPDGRTVSGSWNVNLQAGNLTLDATPSTAPPLVTASANVLFPNLTPVPGAVLTASGLSGSYSDTTANYTLTYYLPSAITQGIGDVDGLAIIYGYQTSPTILGTATFDDTVLKQSSQPVTLAAGGTASTIGLDYMPYVSTTTNALTANSGDAISVTFTDTNDTLPVVGQDVTLTETSVTSPILAASSPQIAAAATCPTTFTGKTDALGKVTIPLCTSVAGLHTYSITSVGAVKKYSTITMNVSTQASATSYALTGPSSGIVNTTSKNFTITPDGAYTGTVTISVVGGGMNNTIPLTFSNSAVPQTFTINPIATGTVTISATSSPALTNPASLTYTVNPAPATTFTFTGPSSGAVNQASSAFTITPNGVYTGTITVTASGALTQTITKTFTISSAPQTFTITPTATGTVILAATNNPSPGNGKLTNPSSLAYSVKLAGLTPTLTNSNNSSTGFTVNVTNYNSNYTYSAVTTAGTLTRGTASGSTLPFVVSGLSSGQSATITVTTSRTGYTNGQAAITGTASGSYVISSISASPTSSTVSTGYSALSTQSTITLTRSGSSGQSPSATVTVNSGTWSVVSDNTTNLTTNNGTVTSAASATVTLKNTTGSFKLSLVAGSGVGTYSATIASGAQSITYTVNILASYTIASATASPASASVGIASIASLSGSISSTATTTTITGLSSTSDLLVGMSLTRLSGVGAFGGATTILTIDSPTQITINSTTANTTGSISFSANGYTATTQSTITLTRGGSSGSNPSTTLTVTSGTWSLVAGSGVTLSPTTINSSAPITVSLTAATGTFTIRLNNGASAATHSATLASVSPLTYSVTLGNLPTAVQNLACVKGSRKGTASCTWIAPTNSGSTAIVRYEYRIKPSTTTNWPTTWTSNNLALSVNLSGLSAGVIYNIEVRTVNSFGAGLIATSSFTA